MCSNSDTDFAVDSCMRTETSVIDKICRKCNENQAEVVLRKKHSYCRGCFVQMATHKFRATLGRSKVVKAGDNVIISFSGSEASAALVHLVSVGLSETAHKRLCFNPFILYIDEGCVLGQSHEERKDVCSAVRGSIVNYKLPGFTTTLETVFDDGEIHCHPFGTDVTFSEENERKLSSLFAKLNTLTSKEDVLRILRQKVLRRAANTLKCSKVFVADTATGLATTLLTNVSLGRGAHLPLDVGFCDDKDCSVKILRPMRDFMKKEAVFYNIFNKVVTVTIPSLSTKVNAHGSIQKLTEKFVMDLQQDFPSTASVVFRTGEKLSIPMDLKQSNETCALCEAALDDRNMKSSSLHATEFSRAASRGASSSNIKNISELVKADCLAEVQDETHSDTSDKKGCGSLIGECGCNRANAAQTEMTFSKAEKCFCYGCRKIMEEVDNVHLLPHNVQVNMLSQMKFNSMREEIADFLL